MARPLPEGAYEHAVTRELEVALQAIEADRRQLGAITDDESAVVVARHVAREITRVLGGTSAKGRAEAGRALGDRLLEEIAEFAKANNQDEALVLDQRLAPPTALAVLNSQRPATDTAHDSPVNLDVAHPQPLRAGAGP
jgi:hypothetical protein